MSWSDPRVRSAAWQGLALALVGVALVLAAWQLSVNLRARGIASGFGYLDRSAGIELSGSLLSFSATDSYGRALVVGVVNTLRMSVLGIIIATLMGLAVGLARLSTLWSVAALSRVYVEVFRNTPLLLQLLFWYAATQALPGPREAMHPMSGVFLCNRGLFVPSLTWADGATLTLVRPNLVGFNFRGGLVISPEFAALLIGLSTYTAAFIAETIRGGVRAVGRGQVEAAAALGLSRARSLRLVVLPQALRVIIPPTTSLFLGLVKNSSLAVAIGYSDLIAITDSTLNQTGQAVEAIGVAMTLYLTISLAIALVTNRYNRVVALRGGEGRRR